MNPATSSSSTPSQLLAAGRWDLYGPVHKGLRRRHAQLLQRIGSADFAGDITPLLADLRGHLQMAAVHLIDEEIHIHRRLDARAPDATVMLESQHNGHRHHLDALEEAIRALEAQSHRTSLCGHSLYLAFTRFVAEDLLHMAHEEEVTWPLLCSLYSDDELAGIEAEIVASLPPALSAAIMSTMVAAVNTPQRIHLLRGIQAHAPAGDYATLLDAVVKPALSEEEQQPLRALGLLD